MKGILFSVLLPAPLTRQIAALSQRRSLLQNRNGNRNGNGNYLSVRSAHAQSASLPPREPLTHFLGACQNLCWRLLRGLSVGGGGSRTNTAGRQCVLSCASAYSRVRRGARQREPDTGYYYERFGLRFGRYSIIFP